MKLFITRVTHFAQQAYGTLAISVRSSVELISSFKVLPDKWSIDFTSSEVYMLIALSTRAHGGG